ncbi:MAG: hypothetical protein AAGF66_09375 [Cyanobacteria bacterium P01_H01_bin.119]
MFEPILAGIILFVLFVFSTDIASAGKGKPDWVPFFIPKWLFSPEKEKPTLDQKFGEAVRKTITQAIKDADGDGKG